MSTSIDYLLTTRIRQQTVEQLQNLINKAKQHHLICCCSYGDRRPEDRIEYYRIFNTYQKSMPGREHNVN